MANKEIRDIDTEQPKTPEEEKLIAQAELVIYRGSRRKSLGAKTLLHNDFDRERGINHWIIYFRPPKSPSTLPPAKVGIDFNLETKKYTVVDCPGFSFGYEAVFEVRDIEPGLVASALSAAIFQGPVLEAKGEKLLMTSSELPRVIETEHYPKIWLITENTAWRQKAKKALSELKFSPDEILITNTGNRAYQQLTTAFENEGFFPELIGIACPFARNLSIISDVVRYFPLSPKIILPDENELTNEFARMVLRRNSLLQFDDVLSLSADKNELKKCLQGVFNYAPRKWMESLNQ